MISEGPWKLERSGDKLIIRSAKGDYICHVSEEMYSTSRIANGEMVDNFVLMTYAPSIDKLADMVNNGMVRDEKEVK